MIFLLLISFFYSDSNHFPVRNIHITGNTITESFVIKREILFRKNDRITDEDINISRKRIENLGIFTSVSASTEIDNDSVDVTYTVYEKFPLLILPVVSTDGLNTKKVTYGVKAKHINMFGKRHSFDFTALRGDKSSYSLFYHNPWIGGTDRMALTTYANKTFFQVPVDRSIEMFQYKTGLTVGKGFGPFVSTAMGFSYTSKHFPGVNIQNTSVNGADLNEILEYFVSAVYDTRDFYLFPKSGIRSSLTTSLSRILGTDKHKQVQLSMMFAYHHTFFNKLTHISRVDLDFRFGDPFYYHQILFNGPNVVRGQHFSDIFGTRAYLFRNEFRWQPLSDFLWSLNIPYVGKYLQNLRTKTFVYSFYDLGTLTTHASDFFKKKPYVGFGFGVGVIFPYMQAIRYEVSFNEGFDATHSLGIGLAL